MTFNYEETLTVADMYQFYPYCKEYETISFDLFDTLIYRRFFSLEEIKYKVYELMQGMSGGRFHVNEIKFIHEHFSNLLKDSRKINSDEPLLSEVYRVVLSALGVDAQRADEVVAYEVELEKNNLNLYSDVIDILSKLKNDGKKLVITSDMYFSQAQIEYILGHLGILGYFSEVYVSSEYGERKATSKLFKLLFPDTDKVIHIGDNIVNDYKQAVKSKIFALHLVRNHPVLFGSVLPMNHVDNKNDLIELMSESVLSMVLKTFDYAKLHDIEKIYFLSRDATPFLEVAEQIKHSSLGSVYHHIKVDELCLGRYALGYLDVRHGKYFLEDVLDRFSWMHHDHVTLDSLLTTFGFDKSDIQSQDLLLKWKGRESAEYVANVIKKKYGKLEKDIESYILENNELAISYIKSKKAIGSGKSVWVDIGYSGTVALYVSNYLTREGDDDLRKNTDVHFLMMITSTNFVGNAHFAQPYVKIREGLIITKESLPSILQTNFSWIETFFKNSKPERGPLLGYAIENAEIVPKFEQNTSISSNELLKNIIGCSIEKLGKENSLKYLHPEYVAQIRNMIIQTFQRPSTGVLEAMKDLVQEFSPLQTEVRSVIYQGNGYQTLKATHKMINKDYWVAGSYQANGVGELIDSFDSIVNSKNKFPFWQQLQLKKLGFKK